MRRFLILGSGEWFFGNDRAVLHRAAAVGVQKCVEAVNEIELFAIENLCEVPDAGSLNSLLTDFPCLGDAIRPIDVVSNLQTLVGHPSGVVLTSCKRWTDETFADLFALLAVIGPGRVLALEPNTDRHPTARPKPLARATKESGLVEEVFGTLDAPNDVERLGAKLDCFGVASHEACLRADAIQSRRHRRPPSLHGAERHARRINAAQFGEPDRRAAHATTDVDEFVAGADLSEISKRVGQLTLRDGSRFIASPKTVMDVRSPQQPIEQRAELIVAANGTLLNSVDCDHDGCARRRIRVAELRVAEEDRHFCSTILPRKRTRALFSFLKKPITKLTVTSS